jgi:flagellar hook-length control protein FliK
MTQVFANISSLANFLVAQKNISKTQTGINQPVAGFEDFLSGQMNIGDLPANSQNALDCGIGNNPDDIEESVKSNIAAWELSGFIKLPIQLLTAPNEQTVKQPIIDTGRYPLETIVPVQINLGQLKQLASQQIIPLSLTLNPAELASIINVNELNEESVSIPNIPGLKTFPNQELQLEPIPADLLELTQIQDNKAKAISTTYFSASETEPQQLWNEKRFQLTFDAGKLMNTQDAKITASISQTNSTPRETRVKVADLLNLIREMPEKPIVQIKAIPTHENQDLTTAQFGNSPEILKFEKSLLVNLKSMVTRADSESVDALQKTTLIKTVPAQTTIQTAALNNTAESINIANGSIPDVAEMSMPAGDFIKPERQQSRKSDEPQMLKTDTIEPRQSNAKLPNQEIQPVELGKPTDYPLTNAFSKGQVFNKAGHQIAAEGRQLPGGESPNFIIKQHSILNQIQSQLKSLSGNTQLTILLKPESLGKVKVELRTDGDKLNATFRVDSPDVKRVLDAELPNLKSDWKIDNFRVETNARGANDNLGNSTNFNQTRMSDGRSSGASFRTNQSENERKIQNQNATRNDTANRNSRIDILA